MEVTALLNRYRALKPYRGFESLSRARFSLVLGRYGMWRVSRGLGATYRTGGQFSPP